MWMFGKDFLLNHMFYCVEVNSPWDIYAKAITKYCLPPVYVYSCDYQSDLVKKTFDIFPQNLEAIDYRSDTCCYTFIILVRIPVE